MTDPEAPRSYDEETRRIERLAKAIPQPPRPWYQHPIVQLAIGLGIIVGFVLFMWLLSMMPSEGCQEAADCTMW